MLTTELDYDLPPDLIAQSPIEPRDASRLLVANRRDQTMSHRNFRDIVEYFDEGDVLIANDTGVINARLKGVKPTGGQVEVLLLRKQNANAWLALVGGRNVREIVFNDSLRARVEPFSDSQHTVIFNLPVEPFLDELGETPLPPYIHKRLTNPSRYQTVYARVAGSAAAPTAGLHFTPQLIQSLQAKGVRFEFVTLHVGLDTFKPIDETVVEDHKIHAEWCELSAVTAEVINLAKSNGKRVIAVGTTSARVLESAHFFAPSLSPQKNLRPFSGLTSRFIKPDDHFQVVDCLITNFHLPRSTLLSMVGAFMSFGFMRRAYADAIQERYRFFSFGDAMLIL
jgi:S-adenosylmethionine:tRNA ribosyltransferase-isomerase